MGNLRENRRATDERTTWRAIRWTCAVMVCAWSIAAAPAAVAASPGFSAIQASKPSVDWSHRGVSYVLPVESGPSGAQFGLQLDRPGWPEASTGLTGSPVALSGVELEGPGVLRQASIEPVPPPVAISRRNSCKREVTSNVGSRFWIEMPANTQTRIVVKSFLAFPAWPHTVYGLQFSTFEDDSTVAPLSPIASIRSSLRGPTGTRISLHLATRKGRRHLSRAMSPRLRGTTTPPLRQGRIALRAVRLGPVGAGELSLKAWSSRGAVKLGGVTSDGRGRFRVPPGKLPGPGRYAFLARSAKAPGVAADWNCGPFFRVSR